MKHYLTEPESCHYDLSGIHKDLSSRFSEYATPFHVDPYHYRLVPNGVLVSPLLVGIERHWQLIPECYPFGSISQLSKWILRAKTFAGRKQKLHGVVCPLLDHRRWHSSYFHWFLDILPRALAASIYQQRSNQEVRLIVPPCMNEWQRSSLRLLGFRSSQLVAVDQEALKTSIIAEKLLVAPSARAQACDGAPYDAICPSIVRLLRERIMIGIKKNKMHIPDKIFITRNDASSRRIKNEDELMVLLGDHGFERISLDKMPFEKQVQLFHSASHIIACHGAALTNLLFSSKAKVLEIFSEGHGIRPEYYQLACINGLEYHYDVCPSVNRMHDISVNLKTVDSFLRQTLVVQSSSNREYPVETLNEDLG